MSPRAFRSAQPSTGWLARMVRRHGIRTVVNLRGYDPTMPPIVLEEDACHRLGVRFENLKVYSRALPPPEILIETKELLERIEYPALFHCKSGADRTGMLGTLYLHWMEGVPVEETRQLRFFPFFHVRYARTGIIDHFFESYLEACREHPVDLLTWIRTDYDPEALEKRFHSRPWFDLLVDRLLRRE